MNGPAFQGNEGQSQRNLVKAYMRAAKAAYAEEHPPYSQLKRQSVLLIDDFHLSLASVMSNNFSQNSQIFMAALMSGCDDPSSMFDPKEGVPFIRVPIIATANSVKELYSPILRHGRARLYHWDPTPDERKNVALTHLGRLGRDDLISIADKYRTETPVFFRELVNRALEVQLIQIVRSGKVASREAVLSAAKLMDKAEIERLAIELKKSEALRSYKFTR